MSSEPEEPQLSKKAAKKEAAKLEKLRRRQEAEVAALASSASSLSVEEDPHSSNYGDVPLPELQSCSQTDAGNWTRAVANMNWTKVGALTKEMKGKEVLIRGRAHTTRPVSGNMTFLVVREKGFTVQCLVSTKSEGVGVSRQMVKFVSGLNRESIVDVVGVVSLPENPIKGATQQVLPSSSQAFFFLNKKNQVFFNHLFLFFLFQVEIMVGKLYCVNKAMPTLPINIEDAARSDAEIEASLKVCYVLFFFSCSFIFVYMYLKEKKRKEK